MGLRMRFVGTVTHKDEKTEFTNTINKSQDEAGYKKEKRQARGWGFTLQCCGMYRTLQLKLF